MKKSKKSNMKTRKILMVLVFLLCISCKETVREELHIMIQNRTDDLIYIKLYPKDEFMVAPDLYLPTDIGGGVQNTEFSLPVGVDDWPNWSEIIFRTRELSIEPHTLAAKVFDSIHISTADKDNVIIFAPDNVIGYSENIFSENSTWISLTLEDQLRDQFRKNPVKYYQYRFLILNDNILNK